MRKIISLVLALVLISAMALALPSAAASYMVGDLDGDLAIGSIDLNLLKRCVAGAFSAEDSRCADINGDLQINTIDINLVKRHLTGSYTIVQPGDGTSISEYTVVYPVEYTPYELYAAEILVDTVKDNYGVTLNITTDDAPEADKEILIGATNRGGSTTSVSFANNQYFCKLVDNDIVINGKDYMIGGGVAALCYDFISDGIVNSGAISSDDVALDYVAKEADSVILMIGDGMGLNHIKYTATAMKKVPALRGLGYKGFVAEQFPNIGTAATHSVSDLLSDNSFEMNVTDSAASSTALATGWKTQNGKLGINALGVPVINVRELAYSLGYKTGVMSTEPMTGATPSGFTVHIPDRDSKSDIEAAQNKLVANGEIDYMKGGVYDDLLAETKIALDTISTDSKGFFIMIEEAYIDKAVDSLYDSESEYVQTDIAMFVYRLNTAVQYAATFTAARPGTVLIVTADHETGALTVGGNSANGGMHTQIDVPVFAIGAGTEYFNGKTVLNTDISKFIAGIYSSEEWGGNYGIDFTGKLHGDFVFPVIN